MNEPTDNKAGTLAEVEQEAAAPGLIAITQLPDVTTQKLLESARQGDLEALIEVTKLSGSYRRHPDSFDYLFSLATSDAKPEAAAACKEISVVLSDEKELELLWLLHWRGLGAVDRDDINYTSRHKRLDWFRRLRNIGYVGVIIAFTLQGFNSGEDAGWAAYNAKNYQAARLYWEPQAEKGNTDALNQLGWMHQHGMGVPVDMGKAVEYYRKAADQGAAASANNLAFCYEDGGGVPKDPVEAYKWYTIAIKKGSRPAMENRRTLAETMTEAQINKAKELADEWHPK